MAMAVAAPSSVLALSRRSTHGRFVTPLRPPPRVTNTARPGMSGFSFVKFAIVGGLAHWLANFFNWARKPKTAPGPTEALVRRQQRAQEEAEEAKKQFRRASQFFVNTRESTGVVLNRSAPEIVSCARRRLEGALASLREANAELREAQADLRAYPVPDYLAPAQEQGAIMIGVTGYPGVGKSSWVNAVRRVSSPNDPDFAELCVDGPTMEPHSYRFPAQTNKPCVIWDLPGVGTAGFPPETYLQNLGIRHFDVVVLITDQRFTEAELLLLEDLRHWNVPFFMVRNKIDLDVQRELESEQEVLDNRGFGDKLDNEERRNIVRETLINVKEDLSILHHVDSVYCISAIKEFWHSFDFPRLEQDLTVALRRQRASEEGSMELVEG